MSSSDKAARDLAELMISMRIEIRKLCFSPTGTISDMRWHNVYDAMRAFEDAQVRDMVSGPNHEHRRRRRIRRDVKEAKAVPTEIRRKTRGTPL
jgi:hypothetical protein